MSSSAAELEHVLLPDVLAFLQCTRCLEQVHAAYNTTGAPEIHAATCKTQQWRAFQDMNMTYICKVQQLSRTWRVLLAAGHMACTGQQHVHTWRVARRWNVRRTHVALPRRYHTVSAIAFTRPDRCIKAQAQLSTGLVCSLVTEQSSPRYAAR